MDKPLEPNPMRDVAFQKAGRNLANFQLLESALKTLLPSLSSKGSVSNIEAKRREQARTMKKASLGTLAEQLHARLFASEGDDGHLDASTEPAIAFAFHIEAEAEFVSAHKKRWLALVKERNRLVHTELRNFDLESKADCERLCRYLDEQNTRIRQHFVELEELRAARSAAAAEFLAFLDSEEFTRLLESPGNGA